MPSVTAPAPSSDAMLVRRCRAGEEAAWAELVQRFSRYVFAICTQAYRLRDADAEEVFQEVFARTYERMDGLRDEAAIRPWLGQLTRRLCVDRLRAAGREQVVEDLPEEGHVDEVLARLDDALSVRAALEQLPEHCAEVLDRFFARDESYRTIGEELDLPAGTIASRISRCLDKLRHAYAGTSG